MKFLFILLCMMPGLIPASIHAESWKETRNVIYTPAEGNNIELIEPDQSVTAFAQLRKTNDPTKKFLRVVGNLRMPAPLQTRGESNFRLSEFYIDDNLDSLITRKEKYSLYFKGNGEDFERQAYYRISQNQLGSGKLTVSLPVVRKEALKVSEKGFFGLAIEVFYNKKGRASDDIYDTPDTVLYMPIEAGSCKYRMITKTFDLPDNTACLLLQLGGMRFDGECWFESPQLKQNGKLIASIPFLRYDQRKDDHNYWVGINLATRSWPLWELKVNGKTVMEDHIFDRASNVADFFIPLPSDLKEKDELTLTLKKEAHRVAFPYELHTLEIIEETARDLEVISLPRFVQQYRDFGVLVETNKPDLALTIKGTGNVIPRSQEIVIEQPGLHVIPLKAGKAGAAVSLTFIYGENVVEESIEQIIEKESDNIYLSCGDDIYIDKRYTCYDMYFKWYFSNRIGNWFQFRPSYQWSGLRIADPAIIRHYVELLDQLKVPYAWQTEGRTLAGSRINPSLEVLNTPSFKGKQAHENDGGYYYWNHFLYKGLYSDMAARTRPLGGIFAKHRPIYTNNGTYIHYDTKVVKDMADGARRFVSNLNYSKGESTRHTGPSSLFRYFYQAGYEWLGAEQMYGPEEVILSTLRGASRAYYRPEYGSLHAMQWGSFPFTDPKHALRFYMSLAVAYMHGSSHINTEDALWVDEYMHDRYSASGKAHLFSQHQLLDYIETHTRRGELSSNVAVLQGRNDAWKSFGHGNLWGQEGGKWKFNKACESFDLLHVFYPDNIIDGCGPDGWFTSTPYGTVDILPVEASAEVMKKYKALIFLGWNTFSEDDFVRIRDFVAEGGTLLLSAAHLNAELQPDQPVQFPENDAVVREMLGNDYRKYTTRQDLAYGNGRIVYFPQAAYPSEDNLKEAYITAMKQLAENNCKAEVENGWIHPVGKVGFCVWNSSNRRTLYLLNTEWKSDKDVQKAELVYGKSRFDLSVRRYQIETVHCNEGLALHPLSNTTDILSIGKCAEGWKVSIQTTGADKVQCMNALTGTMRSLELDDAGIHDIIISE